MSTAVARSSVGYTVPTSQNTAPVIEFSCLFTHDLKRKQKRWQDGVLRFHTFNRRIMIYDTQGSYIGDKHWKHEDDPEEGGELTLDKGALVEVGEQKSTTETDISGLFQRKNKATPDDAGPESPRPRRPLTARNAVSVNTPQPKHKSLGALLGARQGAYGRAAIPTKSPYQIRQEERENETPIEERAVKRQRLEANVQLARKPLSLWTKTSDALNPARPQGKTVAMPDRGAVDLTSDEPCSDVTVPPTPPSDSAVPPRSASSRLQVTTRPAIVANTSLQEPARRQEAAHPSKQSNATPKPVAVPETDTRKAEKSHLRPSDLSAKPAQDADATKSYRPEASVYHTAPAEAAKQSSPPIQGPTRKPTQSRPLRIVKAPPRRMLMCMDEPPIRKTQMAIDLDNFADIDTVQRREDKASSGQPQRKQEMHQAPEPKKKAKRKSLLDIEEELDAIDRDEGPPSSAEAAPASIPKPVVANATRTPLSRTTSVDVTTRMPAIDQIESLGKLQRRSPLKKAKSMSTTDAGNDAVAKKSRSSKSAATTATKSKTATELAPTLKSTAVEPWSVEAFDLFAWRPPKKAAVHEAVSIA